MLRPRKNELSAVMEVMESEDYETAEQMAAAAVKAVAAELGKRKVYVIRPQAAPLGYGPYYSEKDAEAAWTKEIGPALGCTAGLLRVYGWADEDARVPGVCECGHWKEQHVVKVRKGQTIGPFDCGICDCKQFSTRKDSDNE